MATAVGASIVENAIRSEIKEIGINGRKFDVLFIAVMAVANRSFCIYDLVQEFYKVHRR